MLRLRTWNGILIIILWPFCYSRGFSDGLYGPKLVSIVRYVMIIYDARLRDKVSVDPFHKTPIFWESRENNDSNLKVKFINHIHILCSIYFPKVTT